MKGLFLTAIAGLMITVQAEAALRGPGSERSMASKSSSAKCQHLDGDGAYSGSGKSLHAARSQATEVCFNRKLDMYAARHNGDVPDDETVDLMMDACVNICRK